MRLESCSFPERACRNKPGSPGVVTGTAGGCERVWSGAAAAARREIGMPKFVIEREIPGIGSMTDAQIREIAQKSVGVLHGMGPEIQWLQSYVTGDKLYCVYLAPDEAAVREHARRGGFPANRISAVRRMMDPTSAEA
jgi:hypothetical protein